jgi:eukaryotic-like serine/threonine-protein kinase
VPQPLGAEQWQRLQASFAEADALAPSERQSVIDRLAADAPELAEHLRGMLREAPSAEDVLRSVVAAAADAPAGVTPWVGRAFGPYRVVREIGRGGMGVVFEAHRHDEFSKRVALKIAPWAVAQPGIAERFRRERQILADLEHPGIARLLDGGTDDGTPYFVMEYVDGVPVTTYCRTKSLPLRDAVGLVRQVAAALQHAHQHLVVHRDLKPSNVLVTPDGTVKVLDFGIARILDAGGDPSATLNASVGLTPDYASPEQVSGRPVSTRTDVYALGLVLYELLTGERAQVADTSSPMALARSVEHEAPAPSARARARGDAPLARTLAGDLDTIVATATRKEPELRYSSMEAFSEDLQRWLDGRPILARPQTWRYRAQKALGRNRALTGAAAVVLLVVGAGVGSTVYQARRAERQFAQVRRLARTMMVDVHDRIDDLAGATDARKFLVATSLEYLEALRRDAGTDPALAKELAAGYERVGLVQGHPLKANLGDTAGAIASFRRADELLTSVAAGGDREARAMLGETLMELGDTLRATGDARGMSEAYTRARALATETVAEAPEDVASVRRLGETCATISRAAATAGQMPLAEDAARCAMAQAERALQLTANSVESRDQLTVALNALGGTLVQGKPDEAATYFRRSAALREALVADVPDNATFKRNLMVSYGNLAEVLAFRVENLGRPAEAIEALRKATALAEEALARDPQDRRATFDIVNASLRLGAVMSGEAPTRADALVHLQRADRLNEALLAEGGGQARYGSVGLAIDRQVGETLELLGRRTEAIAYYERVRARARAMLDGPQAPAVRLTLNRATTALAALHADAGHPAARTLVEEVEREWLPKDDDRTIDAAHTTGRVGRVYLALAARAAGASRASAAERARGYLEQADARWRALTLAPPAEHVRTRALAGITADLTRVRALAPAEVAGPVRP